MNNNTTVSKVQLMSATNNNYVFRHGMELLLPPLVGLMIFRKRNVAMSLVCLVAVVMVVYFFRGFSPSGSVVGSGTFLCPCDGVVMDVDTDPYERTCTIKIFLNVFNIHVQYSPCEGLHVLDTEHIPGTFNAAYLLEKSQYNERFVWKCWAPGVGHVTITQIAGQLARRIVPFAAKGDVLGLLQPLGLIKLGSRVDVTLPISMLNKVRFVKGQRVRIGDVIVVF